MPHSDFWTWLSNATLVFISLTNAKHGVLRNEDNIGFKNENNNEDDINIEDDLKSEDSLKKEKNLRNKELGKLHNV